MRIFIEVDYIDPWPGGDAVMVGGSTQTYTDPPVVTFHYLAVPVANSDNNSQISDNITAALLADFESQTMIEVVPADKITVSGVVLR